MRWGIIGWILTLRRWLLYGNPSRPRWRLLLFTKLEQARYVLWAPGTVSPVRRESSVFVTAASDAVSLPRHNLQWPWRQWEVTRRLCGWSRRIKRTPILETKAQPNTSPVALLAAILTYCFNGHSSPVCPIFFFTFCGDLWTLLQSWCYPLGGQIMPCVASLADFHFLYPNIRLYKPRKNHLFSPRQQWSPSVYLSWETIKVQPVHVISYDRLVQFHSLSLTLDLLLLILTSHFVTQVYLYPKLMKL